MAKRIIPGQPIRTLPANSLNRAMDLADRERTLLPAGGPHGPARPVDSPRHVVQVKNMTGGDLIERSIVGVKETAFTLPNIDELEPEGDLADVAVLLGEVVEVELPDADKHTAGRWGVTLGPIADGAMGSMAIGGLVKCRIDVLAADHTCVQVVTDETRFVESAASGTPITFCKKQGETGEDALGKQWGQINLGAGGPRQVQVCRATEFIGVGGPLPLADAETPIGLIYGGGQANSAGYDWEAGDAPSDLALWGVGSVAPVLGPESFGASFKAVNVTGRWIFAGALLTVVNRRWIVGVDSPQIIYEEYTEGSGSIYFAADGQRHTGTFSGDGLEAARDELTMPSSLTVEDPTGVRGDTIAALGASETAVFVHATGRLTSPFGSELVLRCIGPGSAAGGGGGGFPGWPGPDPGTGTAMLILLEARVNDADDVAASDATFAFDGATVAGGLGDGTAPASGTCANCGHAWTNNERLLVAGDGTTWQAIKLTTNWLRAKVNAAGGVAAATTSFTFDNISTLVGQATALASPVAVNVPGVEWLDNEDFTAYQRADGTWQPIKDNWNYFIRVKGEAVGAVTAASTSFTIDNVAVLQGDLPKLSSGALTIQNVAKIPLANNEVVEVRYNDADGQWETEPRVTHMVTGKATAAVTGGSFSIDNIELISGSDPRSNPSSSSETLSLSNPCALHTPDNGDVIAEKKANGQWIAVQADPPAPPPSAAALFITIGTITGASYSSPTLTPGSGTGYMFVDQGDGTWDKDTGEAINLYNSVTEAIAGDTIVQAKLIDGKYFIDVVQCDG